MTDRKRIALSFFLWGCGEGFYLYIWPLYLAALGAGPVQIGLVYAVSAASAALVNIPGGHLADRFGRLTLIRLTLLIALPVPIIYALAPNWWLALPGVVLYGASFAMLPALNSYLTAMPEDDSRPHARTSTLGSMYGFFSLGFVVTPWIGGQLAVSTDIRWVFLPSFVCFLASTFAIWNISQQSPAHQLGSSTPARVALRALLANRRYLLAGGLTFGIVLAVGLTLPFAAPYAQHVAHLSDAWIGLLGSFASFGDFSLGLLLGFLAARMGSSRTMLVLLSLCAASFVWLLLAKSGPTMLPAFLLRGGFAAGLSLLTVKVGQTLPPHLLGAGFGIFETLIQVALIISSYAGGIFYGMQLRLPFQLALGGILLCLIALPYGRLLWMRDTNATGMQGVSDLLGAELAAHPLHPSSVPSVHALHD